MRGARRARRLYAASQCDATLGLRAGGPPVTACADCPRLPAQAVPSGRRSLAKADSRIEFDQQLLKGR